MLRTLLGGWVAPVLAASLPAWCGNPVTDPAYDLDALVEPGDTQGGCSDDSACPPPEEPCRVAVCDLEAHLCEVAEAPDGAACEDGEPCTEGDICAAGACQPGGPSACDDGDPCTTDACEPGTGCVGTPISGPACDDGRSCTTGDACLAGVCVGTPTIDCACTTAADCAPFEDGDLCNGTLACLGEACVVDPATLVTCDTTADGPCEVSACEPDTGECVKGPAEDGAPCSDDLACTDGDACLGGECQPTTSDCECATDADCVAHDEDPCDGLAVCVAGMCEPDPTTAVVCVDATPGDCLESTCVPGTGECAETVASDGTPCDDGVSCTQGDACLGGACTGQATIACGCATDADCEPFDDDDLCNGTLGCSGDDTCEVDAATIVTCEPPADPCHEAVCVPETGACVESPVPEGGPCDDENTCTLNDTCHAGVCAGTKTDACPCTSDADCALQEDGNLCNGTLLCVDDFCQVDATTLVSCDVDPDPNDCLLPECDPSSGLCSKDIPIEDGHPCNDGISCTANDTCKEGVCGGVPTDYCCFTDADCDDDDFCTDDACGDKNLCTHTAIPGC